ncbi:hypothetical protein ACFVVX_11500 [Kitasatospora sp. NPDC058170]|uniref:hypothetical protein n=1 Tax=Kitasatospora sp. NPDC058170 TaxID=3346364 RepID=UPI0036D77C50
MSRHESGGYYLDTDSPAWREAVAGVAELYARLGKQDPPAATCSDTVPPETAEDGGG